MKNKDSKPKKSFNRGLYFVLAACLLAVSAFSYAAQKKIDSRSPSKAKEEYPDTVSTYTVSEEPVAKTVSDIADERTKNESVSSQPSGFEGYIMPVKGDIQKDFSMTELQYSKTYSDRRIHSGIDISAKVGSDVKACTNGTVLSVTDDPVWGGVVEIDHNGITADYCCVSSVTVKQGDVVHAGTVIGKVGTVICESKDEPHLHLSFRKDNNYISPLAEMGMGK